MKNSFAEVFCSLSKEDQTLLNRINSDFLPNSIIPTSIYMYDITDSAVEVPVELLLSEDKRFVEIDFSCIGKKSYLLPLLADKTRLVEYPEIKNVYYQKNDINKNYIVSLDYIDRIIPYNRNYKNYKSIAKTNDGRMLIFCTEEYTFDDLRSIIKANSDIRCDFPEVQTFYLKK